MFEQFTYRARRCVVLAMDEAQTLRHSHVGTEHLLLGLITEGGGVAAAALEAIGIDPHEVRSQVQEITSEGQYSAVSPMPLTPRAKKILELSRQEAQRLGNDTYVGTGHILLALIREGQGVAVRVMLHQEADLHRMSGQVRELLADPGAIVADDGGPPETGSYPAPEDDPLGRGSGMSVE